ncbi:hypothetical protein FRB90_012471 [Tulasnella sp. 427]|nr:hypothetical protein FRB90_012471 [Tulasnella sp. 427]
MIPKELFDTDDALFQGMSSDADDEDWSTLRHFNQARRVGKGVRKSKSRSLEQPGMEGSNSGDAKARMRDVGSSREEPARKRAKQSHGLSSPDAGISNERSSSARVARRDLGITSATDRTSLTAGHDLNYPRRIPLSDDPLAVVNEYSTTSPSGSSRPGSPQLLGGLSVETSTKSISGLPPGMMALTSSEANPVERAGPSIRASISKSGSRIITREALLERSKSRAIQPVSLAASGKARSRQQSGSTAKKAKEKQQLPYFELAVDLMDRLSEVVSSKPQVLRGVTLFMITSEPPGSPVTERTKIRLELVIKHGGKVQPAFDHSVYVALLGDLPKGQTSTKETIKRCLGGTTVDDVPHEIRIVGWDWVTNSINAGALQDQLKAEQYMSRVRRYHVVTSAGRPQDQKRPRRSSSEREALSRGDLEKEGQPLSRVSVPPGDPLAKYREEAMLGHGSDSGEEQPLGESSMKQQGRRSYQCMEIGFKAQGPSPNDHIIEILLRVHEASVNPDDRWRVLTYRKAIGSLQRSRKQITNAEDARRLYGIGEKTAEKIAEIITTGDLQRLHYEKNGEYQICQELMGIYGVGPKTAYDWYSKGVRSLDDLWAGRGGISLNENQRIGLKYYDDLQSRMPRAEAAQIFDKIKATALAIDPRLQMEIMGSYRRYGSVLVYGPPNTMAHANRDS